MKKIKLLLAAFICLTFSLTFSLTLSSQTIVEQHGKLSVSGNKVVDKCGRTVQLKGVSFFHHIYTQTDQYLNVNCIGWLRDDWNVQIIRVPIVADRGAGGADKNNYFNNPTWTLNVLYRAIDAAIAKGVYVIVDWHQKTKWQSEAKEFFKKVARKYPNTPNIIWEIWNEPHREGGTQGNDYTWGGDIKPYAKDVITTIRDYSDNLVVVGTPYYSSEPDKPAADPLTKDNKNRNVGAVAYTLHFYANTHKSGVRNIMKAAVNKGIPVFVTECGDTDYTGDGDRNTTEWNAWVNDMKKYNVSWCKWSMSTKDESCSHLVAGAPFNGNWNYNSHLTQAGKDMRYFFRNNNPMPDACDGNSNPNPPGGSDGKIIMRAKGNCGGEKMELSVNNQVVYSANLTKRYANYTYNGNVSSNIKVAYVNDNSSGCDGRLVLYRISVDGKHYLTKNNATRVGSGNNITLFDNGHFDFGSIKSAQVILDTENKQHFAVYPNPASEELYIKGMGNCTFSLYSTSGKLVMQAAVNENSRIDIRDLAKGMYIVKLNSAETIQTQKLLIK